MNDQTTNDQTTNPFAIVQVVMPFYQYQVEVLQKEANLQMLTLTELVRAATDTTYNIKQPTRPTINIKQPDSKPVLLF